MNLLVLSVHLLLKTGLNGLDNIGVLFMKNQYILLCAAISSVLALVISIVFIAQENSNHHLFNLSFNDIKTDVSQLDKSIGTIDLYSRNSSARISDIEKRLKELDSWKHESSLLLSDLQKSSSVLKILVNQTDKMQRDELKFVFDKIKALEDRVLRNPEAPKK